MQLKLVVVAGEALVPELTVQIPAVLGRSKKAEVTLGHPLVSRQHCRISKGKNGILEVKDLGSLNGTYVGKTRIEGTSPLEPGALLTIGSVTFQACYGEFENAADEQPAHETDPALSINSDHETTTLSEIDDTREAAKPAAQEVVPEAIAGDENIVLEVVEEPIEVVEEPIEVVEIVEEGNTPVAPASDEDDLNNFLMDLS